VRPATAGALVSEAVMEAILTVLPELNPVGQEAIPAPEWRQRNLAALVLPLEPAHSLL